MESGNRRIILFEQMSGVDNGRNNIAGQTSVRQRTLLDIIRDDRSNKDKKSWKTFRDKLRLKRAGSAWTSSVRVPASDVNDHSSRSRYSGRGSHRSNSADMTHVEDGGERVPVSDPPFVNSRLQLARRDSVRFGNNPTHTDYDDSVDASMPSDAPPSRKITRHQSTRLPASNADEDDESPEPDDGSRPPVAALAEERSLSAREAVAAQEAAEAAAAAEAGAAEEPVKMSLMDLLGETGYTMGEDDDEYDEEEEEEEDDVVVSSSGGMEYTCCVCMVRHKGSAFIPCGHTFCRLCSRELMVQRGNCPLCNGYILEILDIF